MINKLTQLILTCTGIAIVCFTFYSALTTKTLDFDFKFLDIPSATLIFFSLLGLLFTCFRFQKIVKLFTHLIFTSQIKLENQHNKIRSELKSISNAYYNQGPSVFSKYANSPNFPPIWKSIFEELEASINIHEIMDYVQYSQESLEQNYEEEINILKNLSQMAPSLGLLGTVIGLIKLLAELKDFDTIGPNMSLALVTTLYGLFTSIILINPLINRLEDIKHSNLKIYDLALFWLTMLEKRTTSLFTDEKKI